MIIDAGFSSELSGLNESRTRDLRALGIGSRHNVCCGVNQEITPGTFAGCLQRRRRTTAAFTVDQLTTCHSKGASQ